MQNESTDMVVDVSGGELLNSTVLLVLNDIGFTEELGAKVIRIMSEEEKYALMNRHMHSLLKEVFQL